MAVYLFKNLILLYYSRNFHRQVLFFQQRFRSPSACVCKVTPFADLRQLRTKRRYFEK